MKWVTRSIKLSRNFIPISIKLSVRYNTIRFYELDERLMSDSGIVSDSELFLTWKFSGIRST